MIKKRIYDFLSKHMSYITFRKIILKYEALRKRDGALGWKKAFFIKNGKRNSKKTYMLFRLIMPDNMLIAAAIQYVFAYEFACSKGMIPLIDLEYEYVFEKGKLGYENLWECCFEQSRVKDVIKNENVLVEKSGMPDTWIKGMCFSINGDENDHFIHTTEENWRNYYKKINQYIRKSWIIKPEIINALEKEWNAKINPGDKVLGISLRECFSQEAFEQMKEATREIYLKHPMGPNVDEIIKITKEKMQVWGCNKIFLSTIYESSITEFQKEFGDAVVWIKRERLKGLSVYKENPDGGAMSPKELYYYDKKNNHLTETTISYLKEIIGLSRCNYLLASKSSGSIAALSINGGKYEDIHILSDKNNIKRY